jgi:hypothetical protein
MQLFSADNKMFLKIFHPNRGDQREKFKKTMDGLGRDFEFFSFGL